jgi:hypothetical protein
MIDESQQGNWQVTEFRPWTVARVLDELCRLTFFDQKKVLTELAPQADALAAELEQALPGLKGLAACHAGALLLRLQRRAGRDAVLAAFEDENPAVRSAALDLFRFDFVPEDSGYAESPSSDVKVPLSCAEIFAAISPLLSGPASPEADTALFICLKHDIAASRPLTRGLLDTASGSQRLHVASWYLEHGRDDGALDVLASLLAAAPATPDGKEPSWYKLKNAWRSLAGFSRRASKPSAMRGARLAMRVVTDALDAPDWQRRFDFNAGYISAGCAAEAIAAAMPEGAERLLRRLVSTPIDTYDRGRALTAFCRATGEASRDIVLASLADRQTRKAAAEAARILVEAGATDGLLAALSQALDAEERPVVVGVILSAMSALGNDARPHIAAALARADPWEAMRLNWHLEGGSVRAFADLLVEAGAADPIDDTALAAATPDSFDLLSLLWAGGQRIVCIDIKSSEIPPPHHELFRDLLAIARPVVEVERLAQRHDDHYRREQVPGMPGATKQTDLGTTCIVQFLHGGQEFSFRAYPSGRWFDVASVIAGFDAFMARIGRDNRCYQLLSADSIQLFAVASEARFRPLAERLRIPLQPDPDEPRRRGLEYVRQVISTSQT